MVIESTIEEINVAYTDCSSAYTVRLEIGDANHRILTVATSNDTIASKWTKDVLKSYAGHIIAGICFTKFDRYADLGYDRYRCYEDYSDVIQICVGSHCLIYNLNKGCGKFLNKFFGDYFVETVGMDMVNVAKRLKEKYDIVVKNPFDLQRLVTKNREDLYHYNLYKYDLQKLACAVLGKKYDVVKPEELGTIVDLFQRYYCLWNNEPDPAADEEKVKFATIDAYLCFLIGEEIILEH